MPAIQRGWRLAALIAGMVALLAGSLWGSDDSFPVGPFRMYATANRSTGTVRAATLVAIDADGDEERLVDLALGLRRAELEGLIPRIRRDPTIIADLARLYERRTGASPRQLRVEETIRRVVDGEVQPGEERRVVATWRP